MRKFKKKSFFIDLQKLSKDFENEGIELSIKKLQKIISAMKTLLYKVLKWASGQDDQNQLIGNVQTMLSERSALRDIHIQAFTT